MGFSSCPLCVHELWPGFAQPTELNLFKWEKHTQQERTGSQLCLAKACDYWRCWFSRRHNGVTYIGTSDAAIYCRLVFVVHGRRNDDEEENEKGRELVRKYQRWDSSVLAELANVRKSLVVSGAMPISYIQPDTDVWNSTLSFDEAAYRSDRHGYKMYSSTWAIQRLLNY
jgi:hypothetical protein